MADRLGVSQQTYSQYERGILRVPDDEGFIEEIARILDMPEPEVWRGLMMSLPPQFRTDEEVIAWAWKHDPEAMAAAAPWKTPPPKAPKPGRKDPTHPRTGERASGSSQDEEDAV